MAEIFLYLLQPLVWMRLCQQHLIHESGVSLPASKASSGQMNSFLLVPPL